MVMEKNLKEVYDRLRTCEEHYEIFKSFVEEDEHPTGLIDRSYTIRYANGAALQSLGISDASEILDQKLFDFFSFEDALKLKEKIDKVFVEGGTEKIKKMTFQNPGGNPSKLKMKLIRVRYRNHPSIKMVIE
jgi:PAS domain S-box-containing protein